MEAMQKIKCLTIEDSNFPDRLRKLSGMPKKLYYIGNLPDPKKPAAAVVGARMCSPYGRCQAFKYARTMASYGVQIISGMARGIDAEGHKGALDTDTPTFAVLGSGVDVCYPNSNRWLYQRILEKGGGIISELPPGSPPVNWAFPARNRIISGLAEVVVIAEAKKKSGSLITAEHALEQGKDIYVFPGRTTDALSYGCNTLIQQGAGIILSVEEFLKQLPYNATQSLQMGKNKKQCLAKEESLVYSCLSMEPKNIEKIAEETGLGISATAGILLGLLAKGLVFESFRNYYIEE